MIPTIPLDLFINLLVGETMAYAARKRLAEGQWRTPFYWTIGLIVVGFLPFAALYIAWYADWSWMYLFDVRRLPPVWWASVLTAYVLMGAAGFLLGAGQVRRGGTKTALTVEAVTLLLIVVLSAVGWKQLLWVGTYEEFRAGTAHLLLGDRLLWIVLLQGAVFLPAWALSARALERR